MHESATCIVLFVQTISLVPVEIHHIVHGFEYDHASWKPEEGSLELFSKLGVVLYRIGSHITIKQLLDRCLVGRTERRLPVLLRHHCQWKQKNYSRQCDSSSPEHQQPPVVPGLWARLGQRGKEN